jgi:hypothetical protein
LHITWQQQSIQGDGTLRSLSLYYTRSEDGGSTFSDAERVIDEPVAWRELVADGKDHLHLLWQPQDTMTTVWDQVSSDGGRSWQFPQGLPDEGTTAAIMVDSVGQIQLVDAGPGSLGHWLWDGSRWQPEASFHWSLASQQMGPVEFLAGAVNKQGKIVVVWAVPTGAGDAAARSLLYSTRTFEPLPDQTTIQGVPTQTLLPPTLTPVTPTLESSSTPANTVNSEPINSQGQTSPNATNDRTSPFTMALLPVAILLLSVLGIIIRQAARAKDR